MLTDRVPCRQRELTELEKNYKKLEEVINRFHSLLPDDLKEGVSARPKSTDFFKDVSDAMEKVAHSWENRSEKDKFANARRYVRKVGGTMASHSNALKILPSSNDYASAFCGALTVFVKVRFSDRTCPGIHTHCARWLIDA